MTENLLVTTAWLAEHLDDKNLRIVDIRGHVIPATEPPPHYFNHEDEYKKEHIPGAVFVDWVKEITDPNDPRHAQIAKPERYAAVMSRLGIDENTVVVAYDDAQGMFGARLWWSLNYYGHDKVAVLDGGWDKWVAEGRPTSAEILDVEPTEFVPKVKEGIYRSGDAVLGMLGSEGQLMDVRSPLEFEGKAARAKRMGHIPGALNVPRRTLLNEDGTMMSGEALRELFVEAGLDIDAPEIVVYCNGGVSASYGLMALKRAGFQNGAMYDGSWKEWGNDEDKPINV